MSVGANIRKRRFELNMSQQDLANAMGYKCRATIAKIESGENDVNQVKLQKFAQVLDTTVEALINGIDSYVTPVVPFVPQKPSSPDDKTSGTRNVVIIMAGGKSSRNRQNIPNQFITVLGKPIIVYSMEAYQYHPSIDDIYVVCLKGWDNIVKAYAEQFNITKLRGIIPSGNTGIESVKNGFDAIAKNYDSNDTVVIQESTRPMVSVEMISKLLWECNDKGSANICQSMKDHLQFTVTEFKEPIVNRDQTVEVQSPEAFKFSVLAEVFKKAKQKNHPLTESCCAMLLYNLGYYINFVEGSTNNIKIIRQEDISVFTALLKHNLIT